MLQRLQRVGRKLREGDEHLKIQMFSAGECLSYAAVLNYLHTQLCMYCHGNRVLYR